MKAIQGYHLIKPEDLFWRPSNLMPRRGLSGTDGEREPERAAEVDSISWTGEGNRHGLICLFGFQSPQGGSRGSVAPPLAKISVHGMLKIEY